MNVLLKFDNKTVKMIDDESEVFEITDFTTASEWERFIAKLEETIHEWKLMNEPKFTPLEKGEVTTGTWTEINDTLTFADFRFVLTRHKLEGSTDDTKDDAALHASTTDDSGALQGEGERERKEEASSSAESGQSEVEDEANTEVTPHVWQDLMASDNDFPGRAHCLSRWYGLRDFVVLSPAANMDDILSESRANLVLSSVAIALHNTGCVVPIFVQVHQRWRRLFQGQYDTASFRTTFEMIHLKNIPHQYNHMAGLLDVFKAKIQSPMPTLPPVSVGVRFTYILQDWMNYSWPQQPPDIDSFTAGEVGITEFGDLPFGPCEDPVNELQLSTTWPSLSEEMIVDNDVYSDLDPLQAPHWNVRVRMAEHPQCLLGDYLHEFVQLCRRKESTDQLLGKSIRDADTDADMDVSNALSRLTEPVPYTLPSLGTVVTKATSRLQMKPEEAPIPTDTLNEILVFLFPDAKKDHSRPTTPDSDDPSSDPERSKVGGSAGGGARKESTPSVFPHSESHVDLGKYTEVFKQFKSAPPVSLSYRLSVCMCIVNHSHGGLRAVAHLWQEFVLELRYRWENKIVLPDLEQSSPNMGCSLLHQKLQMLNCCIERKKLREAQQVLREEAKRRQSEATEDDETGPDSLRADVSMSSEEEFFECFENADDDVMDTQDPVDDSVLSLAFGDSALREPEGRMKPFGSLRLLERPGEQLYVPLTQEPAPMTEDMLEEHAEVLAKLGTSAEGATLRARMQSACLLSDMESFKAANPGCTLGDFVRWYSPRDWSEEEVVGEDGSVATKGQLSQRMQIPGNVWADVWHSAKSVPARRQRRLFDDTKEAEKVLHWCSAMKPATVALRLLPMLIHAAFTKLLEQEESNLPMLKKLLAQISSKAAKAMRAHQMEVKRFEDLVRQLTMAEVVLTRAQSLLLKFSQERADVPLSAHELPQFVSDLLDLPEVEIIGAARAPLGVIVHRLFMAAQKNAFLLPEEDDPEPEGDKMSASVTTATGARGAIPEFPGPVGKEYILRTMARRPAPWSRPSPQRMFCTLMKDDFRLSGAFSADTTFQ